VRPTIHLSVALVLSGALAGYWRLRIQRQAQRAALRLLQALPGITAMTIQANGTIKIERPVEDMASNTSLEAVSSGASKESSAVRRASRSKATNLQVLNKSDPKNGIHGRASPRRNGRDRRRR
jgi:hypothetical protein